MPLPDVGLMKTFAYSIGCHFVLLIVSFALQKPPNCMRSHLLSVLVFVQLVVDQKVVSSAKTFKALSQFLFCQAQCSNVNVEVFDPLGLEVISMGLFTIFCILTSSYAITVCYVQLLLMTHWYIHRAVHHSVLIKESPS